MVLDFVNDPEKVQEDFFRCYYGSNFMELDDQTDPNSPFTMCLHSIESLQYHLSKMMLKPLLKIFFYKWRP
jgi:type I restriction enzyme R subunit